ncbi:MAG: hypothetical protein EOP84_14940 [Verrucomicrobiaceae bacterium]|nr:MAG: hypothetical protein EOP84_14940 [Verrucomicrobiaceae bacterium]
MKCLTLSQQSEILRTWGMCERPYGKEGGPLYYRQFYTPTRFRTLQSFVAVYLEQFAKEESCLLDVEEWAWYEPYEMELIAAARISEGEERPLFEASGHLFSPEESDLATALISLTTAYGWSSYLYVQNSGVILYNWEGDIMDFWSDTKDSLSTMDELITRYELRSTDAPGDKE